MVSPRKWRVAIIGSRGVPATYSGFETFVEQFSVRLAERGHNAIVFNRYPFIPSKARNYKGVRVIPLRTIRLKSLDTIAHTFFSCFFVPFLRPDILYICGVGNAIFALWPKLLGIPMIVNVDGEDWARKKWSGFAKKWLLWSEKWACKFADVIIADSRAIQRRYRELYQRETEFIPYGANIPEGEPGTAALEKFRLKPRGYILYVGRLVPENRAELIVEAFQGLQTDLKLVIVGDAPYTDEFKRELKAMAGPNVIFTGYAFGNEYRELSQHCYFYVLASGVNATRLVLLDQLGFGVCVLTRNSESNAEVVADAAPLFDGERELASLREKMTELIAHPEMVAEYRRKAVERVRTAYSWERVTDQYLALFEEMTQK